MADFGSHSAPHPDVAGYLFGTLEPDEAQRFADHLDRCDVCGEELNRLGDVPRLLALLTPPTPVPAGLEERTFAALGSAARTAGSRPAADGQGGRPPSEDGTVAGDRAEAVIPIRPPKRGWRRAPLVLVAAAAVVVIGLAAGILTSSGGNSTGPVATVRLVAVHGGPAVGTATVRRTPAGLTIDMTVHNLAPSPPETFYTCWLVGPGDTLSRPNRVSVGSFVVLATGTVTVHWTTAADPRRFPQLGVTLEPNDGNPGHQGPKVLGGTLGSLA
jgi:hypothetical protein